MGAKTFNNVKINLTLKTTTTRANLSTSSEDLAVQLGKIKKWYDDFAWSAFTAPTVEVTGSGNAITSASWSTSNGKLTLTKGSSFSTVSISRNLTSGTKIGTITIDGVATDLYCQTGTSTDTKVTQTAVGSTYTNYRPLVIGASNSATAGFSPSTVTDTTFTTQAIYCQPSSGTIFATKFDGFLAPKLFTSSIVDSTAGSCFFYGNNLLGNGNYDWVGIQGDSGSDKFQLMPYAGNMLLYRQNDNGGSSTAWQDWISLLSPSSVTANGGITATITTTTTGTDDGAVTFNSGVRLSHTNSVTAVTSNSFLKLKYDAQGHITGSAAVAASDLPSHTHPYLPLAGGTMNNAAEITIPNGSHSSQYTGFGMYHYIGAGNAWARGINVNNAADGTRIASLGMYGSANATEPSYAYFGKAYNDAWFELYKSFARINDDEENGFQFRYKPSSLSSGYSASFLSLYPGEAYGYGIVVGHSHGGMTIVSSGESGIAFTDTAFDSTTTPYGSTVFRFDSESLVLTSDDSLWFVSGASGLTTSAHTDWTNLKTALFDSSGNFRPSVDNKGSIGTLSFKWASIHGTTIYENGTSLASKYAAIGHTHDSLTSKTLTNTTLDGTAGNFFFKGNDLIGNWSYDWVGIQADSGNDKFQLMPNGGGSLMYRQNDDGGTNSSSWTSWNGILTASSVTTDSYLSVAATTTTIGSGDGAFTYNSGVKISHKAYSPKTSGLYKITVDAAGHVSATASVAKGDIPALDYVPNTNAGVNAAINLLSTGSDDPVDTDYYISQYANGGTTHTTYHRRPVSALYSYIYRKLQHDNGMNIAHTFAAWNTVGWHRVLSLPCSSSASGKMIRTLELTAVRTYNNAQPEIFSVRLIGLFNTTEGFEILYSKSNAAASQLMTKVRMTKSSDGETLYVDIYYNSTTSNSLTVFCTLIDPGNNNDGFGSPIITWGNGAVVDNSLTVVASLDIPRDITAPGTGFYYVVGTQTASTAAWTGKIPASKLHNGLTIAYYLPYASAASTSVTLNLTLSTGETTGAINVYYTGASRMTTHYGAGSTIILTYFEAGAISVGGTATTDARWTHSDYNSNTDTNVTQSITTATQYRALMLGYNYSTTPSDLTATVTNQVYASAKLYAQPSTGNLYMAGNCTIGQSSQSSYPTGGIHVHDVRNLTVTPDSAAETSANFYFHQYKCDGTNNYWWSVLNVRGWTDAYSSWELAGPSSNADQRTTPLYVRTSNTNSAWGNWRKIYDTANPPTYSEVGAASSSHTHNYAASATAGGTAKGSESWKFTHGNELNVSKLASSYHHCWVGYRFNTDGTEEVGDSTYYISEWRFGDCKGGGLARIYPSAVTIQQITIQTGSSKAQKITLQTLMTWLITTKGYIHSNVNEHVVLTTTFVYNDNDILQFTVNGTNMELQLAGVLIEFIGKATSYNSGIFVLKITAAPTNSFTATSGYTKFYANHTAVYHCNGSGYSPAWSVDSSTVSFVSSQSTSSMTKYYPIFASGTSGPRTLFANDGFYYNTRNGTTSVNGMSELVLGNGTASGKAGNRFGNLAIYSTGAYYAQIRPTTLSANRLQNLPDAGGEIMVRKRTISTLNQGENTMLNGQMALYSASTTGGLGYVDAEITGLFTNWSVIMFAITGCGFGTAGSNKFGIHGIVPLDLTKRQHELSITSEPIVACIQYNPSKTDGLGTVVAQYINDNKIRFSFNVSGPQSMLYVYGLY